MASERWSRYEPQRYESIECNATEWREEVIKAITELTQRVHELNPGGRFEFDLDIIRLPIEGMREADGE